MINDESKKQVAVWVIKNAQKTKKIWMGNRLKGGFLNVAQPLSDVIGSSYNSTERLIYSTARMAGGFTPSVYYGLAGGWKYLSAINPLERTLYLTSVICNTCAASCYGASHLANLYPTTGTYAPLLQGSGLALYYAGDLAREAADNLCGKCLNTPFSTVTKILGSYIIIHNFSKDWESLDVSYNKINYEVDLEKLSEKVEGPRPLTSAETVELIFGM